MNYFKFNADLLHEIGDLRKAAIISFLVNQNKSGDKLKIQKWQQTYLANYFNCEPSTIWRVLKKLENDDWLDFEECNYNGSPTTKIVLTDKALKYRIEETEEKPKKYKESKKQTTQQNNHQSNIASENFTNQSGKLTRAQEYLNKINKEVFGK